jgi:2,2-dialkylglycine decarboxylase (pyruvate)
MGGNGGARVFRYGGDFAEARIARARGTCIYDDDGHEILDFTSGQMSAILGQGHPEIVEVIARAAAELDHLHSSFLSAPVIAPAEALAAMLLPRLDRVLPLSTGGEANEAALRIAKTVTGGWEVVAFDRSWHGVKGGAAAATFRAGGAGTGRRCRAC